MMTNDQMRERLRPLQRVCYPLVQALEHSVFIGVAGSYAFEARMENVEKALNAVEFRRKIDVQYIVPSTSGTGLFFGPYEESEAMKVAAELKSRAIPLEWHPVPKERDWYEEMKS